MLIENSAVKRAANSRFGRLEVRPDNTQHGGERVVCKSSFFTWTVHYLRYSLSRGYQYEVHEMRGRILQAAARAGNPNHLSLGYTEKMDSVVSDRKAFNRHVFEQLNPQTTNAPAQTHTNQDVETIVQQEDSSRVLVINDSAYPEAPGVKKWSNQDNLYDTFWSQKENKLAESGYKNVIRFEKTGNVQSLDNIKLKTGGREPGSKILCAEIARRSERFSHGTSTLPYGEDPPKTTVGCILTYLQFVTPTSGGRHDGLYGSVAFLGYQTTVTPKAIREGLKYYGMEGEPPDGCTAAYLRVPTHHLSVAIGGLLSKHFRDGATKEEMMEGLDQELHRGVSEPSRKEQSETWNSSKLTTEQLEYVVEGMKGFATLYFETDGS